MGEYPKNFINRNKPESKGYILYDPINMAALWAMKKRKDKGKDFFCVYSEISRGKRVDKTEAFQAQEKCTLP